MICSARGCANSGGWISDLIFFIVLITLSAARKSLVHIWGKGARHPPFIVRVFCFTPGDYFRWARSLKADSLLQQVVATGIFIHYKRHTAEKYLPGDQVFLHSLPQKIGNIFLVQRGSLSLYFVPVFHCQHPIPSVMLSPGYCLKAVSPRGTINIEMILRCP
jgi:hypothetical protein